MSNSLQNSPSTPKRDTVRKVSAPKSVPKKGTPKSSRHMYTKEEYRFVWFYRKELQMSRLVTQQFFNEYFGHDPPIARNCIDQVYDRLKRTLPDDVIEAKHTEDWAVGANSGEQEPPRKKRKVADPRDEGPEETDIEEEGLSQGTCPNTN